QRMRDARNTSPSGSSLAPTLMAIDGRGCSQGHKQSRIGKCARSPRSSCETATADAQNALRDFLACRIPCVAGHTLHTLSADRPGHRFRPVVKLTSWERGCARRGKAMRHFAGVLLVFFLMAGLAPSVGRTQPASIPETGKAPAVQSPDKLFLAAI